MRPAILLSLVVVSACARPSEPARSVAAADPLSAIRRVERGRALFARVDAPAPGWTTASAPLVTRPATDGSGTTRIEVNEGFWFELRALDAAPVPMRPAGRARVALAVARGVDVVHVVEAQRFEELRVLHDANASRTARYQLRFGPEVSDVRLVDGTVQLLDREGRVRLASEPLWATDANGASIPVAIRLEKTDGGAIVETSLSDGAWTYPVVVDPGWIKLAGTGTVTQPAAAFELTPGGKVLVVSVTGNTNDLYDPVIGYTFAATRRVSTMRNGAVASRSGSGKVYVVGGGDSTAERYDAATDTWTGVATLPSTISFAAAWPLGTNKLLLAGGTDSAAAGSTTATTRIFDESSGAWTTTGSLSTPRSSPATVVLKDGRPIVIGGFDDGSNAISLVEIFDPAMAKWSLAASMKRPRTHSTAITLASGKVLALGGMGANGGVSVSELYDPATNTWTDLPTGGPNPQSLGVIGASMGLAQLASGRVLYSGPNDVGCTNKSWLYDPTKPLLGWVSGPDTPGTMCEEVPAVLANGQAFYPGAYDRAPITWTEAVANGTVCTTGFECLSGLCVDGICCDTTCTSVCQACNVAGKLGTCSAVPAGNPIGARMCGGSAGCVGTCDGTSSLCVQPATGASCKPASCVGSTFTAASTCDATGACIAPTTATGCAPYACDVTGCKTSCASDGDCATGASCRRGLCEGVSSADAGASDTAAVAEAPAPQIADKPTVTEVQRCAKDTECASGHCVEGVCCDTACADRCHSCALLASPGKCTLEPIGVDLRSDCGAAFTCTGTCDGTGACIGAGKGTMCARNRCTSASTGVGPTYCSGPGAKCADTDVSSFDCTPFVCEPSFGACRTTCVSSNDCANGFVCDVGQKTCVRPVAAEDSSGCAMDPRPSRAAAASFALISLGLVRRRSRALSKRCPS